MPYGYVCEGLDCITRYIESLCTQECDIDPTPIMRPLKMCFYINPSRLGLNGYQPVEFLSGDINGSSYYYQDEYFERLMENTEAVIILLDKHQSESRRMNEQMSTAAKMVDYLLNKGYNIDKIPLCFVFNKADLLGTEYQNYGIQTPDKFNDRENKIYEEFLELFKSDFLPIINLNFDENNRKSLDSFKNIGLFTLSLFTYDDEMKVRLIEPKGTRDLVTFILNKICSPSGQ
ncbi:MAG: hypothetical protein ACTSRA_11910 [Promethearchaeota archaeon]